MLLSNFEFVVTYSVSSIFLFYLCFRRATTPQLSSLNCLAMRWLDKIRLDLRQCRASSGMGYVVHNSRALQLTYSRCQVPTNSRHLIINLDSKTRPLLVMKHLDLACGNAHCVSTYNNNKRICFEATITLATVAQLWQRDHAAGWVSFDQ